MDIWHYNLQNKKLLGRGKADASPLEPGVFLIPAFATNIPPPIAPGGFDVVFTGDGWALEEIPPPPPPEPPPPPPLLTRVYKADVWRRATDQEAEIMDSMLLSLPVKHRRLWQDARYLETTDDYWPLVIGGFTQAFGATRAAELLAPSE